MKIEHLTPGMEVALHVRKGYSPAYAVIVDPMWQANLIPSKRRVAVAVVAHGIGGLHWSPTLVRPNKILGPYKEVMDVFEAEDEARRARAKARNASDDQWHQRRLAVLDRLAKLLKLSVEDRKMRYSIGTLGTDRPAHQVDMAIEDMEKIAAMLEAVEQDREAENFSRSRLNID